MSRAREIAYCLALALLLGASTAACVVQVGIERLPDVAGLGRAGLLALACAAVAAIAFPAGLAVLRLGPGWLGRLRNSNPLPRLALGFDARSVALCACIVFVCWIPWIALQYPAAANSDALNQMYQFQTPAPTRYSGHYVDAEYVDHHPLFDTLLYGSFVWLGERLGSQNAGLFLFSLVQCALTAASLAFACCYLERLRVPKALRLAAVAFVALLPLFPLYAATMVKDSTFSAAFVPWFVLYVEAFRTRGKALSSWRFAGALAIFALLCIVTKKTGVYVTMPGMVVMLVAYRQQRRQLVATLAAPLAVLYLAFPLLLFPAVGGVAPGGNEELFGTLYQQVIAVVRDRDDLTPDELAAVDAVVDVDAAADAFSEVTTDPVKDRRRYGTVAGDYLRFLQAYAAIGARHPDTYAWAVCRLNGSFLAPGKAITYYWTPEQSQSNVNRYANLRNAPGWHYTWYKPEPLKTWAARANEAYLGAVSSNPLAAFLLGRGLYTGWIPAICCLLSCCRDRRYALVFVPIALSVAVLVAGPTSSARYALPLLYATPVMLGVLCHALSARAGAR